MLCQCQKNGLNTRRTHSPMSSNWALQVKNQYATYLKNHNRGSRHLFLSTSKLDGRCPPRDDDRGHRRSGRNQSRGRNHDRGRDHNRERDQGRGCNRGRDRDRHRTLTPWMKAVTGSDPAHGTGTIARHHDLIRAPGTPGDLAGARRSISLTMMGKMAPMSMRSTA